MWVTFKYERLPNLYYWCGCLDHNNRECGLWIKSKGTLPLRARQFGPFMRASHAFTPKNSVVHVSSFFDDRKGKHPNTRYKPDARTRSPQSDILATEPLIPPPLVNYPDMETSNLVEEVITIPNSNSNENVAIKSIINPKFLGKENLQDPFFQQLLDIDNGLQKFGDLRTQSE